MSDIKQVLNSSQIALERQAANKFGAAVDDFTKGTLGPLLGLPSITEQSTVNRGDGSFYSSSYAAALAGGTSYRPKLKFLFKVEFIFTQEAIRQFPQLGSSTSNDFTFMIKTVDRPKVDFDWEEDVNMYNFRTKVLKKIHHRELTMSLMDDTGNRVFNLFRTLMMLYQPITRRQLSRDGTTDRPDANLHGNGMAFSTGLGAGSNSDTSHRGVINSSVGNAIETIRVKQIFNDPSARLNNTVKEVTFDFINARLVSFDLDDLSHETSDPNVLTVQFDYDWMEMVDVGSLSRTDGPIYNISTPGVHGAPVDISPNGGAGSDQSGNDNPFAKIITNQAARAAQKITSTEINKIIKTNGGNNRFGQLLGSMASTSLGGLVNAATQDKLGSLMGGVINQGTSRAAAPTMTDTASGGAGVKPTAVVTSSDAYSNVNPAKE